MSEETLFDVVGGSVVKDVYEIYKTYYCWTQKRTMRGAKQSVVGYLDKVN